jgi:Ca-activated chloride channel family protein
MVGVGVGDPGSYSDALMDQVTDAGKGASVFIANDDEVGKIFGTDFVNTMAVAARNVRVSVDLPAGFEISEFSGEEYSTDPAEVEPQHIAPNDAMVFLQSIRTCAPEELDQDSEITFNLQFQHPTTHEEQERSQTYTINQLLDADRALLRKGQAVFEFAEGVKVFKRTKDHDDLVDAFEAIDVAEELNSDDPDLAEIRMILETL